MEMIGFKVRTKLREPNGTMLHNWRVYLKRIKSEGLDYYNMKHIRSSIIADMIRRVLDTLMDEGIVACYFSYYNKENETEFHIYI